MKEGHQPREVAVLDIELFEQDLQKLHDKIVLNHLHPDEKKAMTDLLRSMRDNYLRIHNQEEKTNKALVEIQKDFRLKVSFDFGIRLRRGK